MDYYGITFGFVWTGISTRASLILCSFLAQVIVHDLVNATNHIGNVSLEFKSTDASNWAKPVIRKYYFLGLLCIMHPDANNHYYL